MNDAEVIKLAQAERDAGVPDVHTAEASPAAKRRLQDLGGEGAGGSSELTRSAGLRRYRGSP